MEEKTVNEWKSSVIPALLSKQGEFKLIGYDDVTIEGIWQCLEAQVWKGNPTKRLHEVVQDIFHLSTATYMSYITVHALKADEDDLLASIDALTSEDHTE